MGYIIIVLASLAVGVVVGHGSNGSTIVAQSGLAAGPLPRINLSHDPQLTSAPNSGTRDLTILQSIKAKSHLHGLQDGSTEYPLPKSMSAELSVIHERSRPLLVVRTLGKSSTSSASGTSSESWSGASGGFKRKVNQELLQHDITWGRSKGQTKLSDKAITATNPGTSGSDRPGPSNKRPKTSTKDTFGSREATSKPKTRSIARNQSDSEVKGKTPGPRQRQTKSKAHQTPEKVSRTADQQARRNQLQQEARQEQKLRLKSGDPEAIKKQAETNARRRELEHARREQSGNPILILPPKSGEEERAYNRVKMARYRKRQRGELKPIVFKTTPEQRARTRNNMRRRRAQQKGLALHVDRSPSESEWKSSGRSDSPSSDPSISSLASSVRGVKQSSPPSDFSWPEPPIQHSQSPTRHESLSARRKGRGSSEDEGGLMKPQQSNREARSYGTRNDPGVAFVATSGKDRLNTNSPTHFQQPPQERPMQPQLPSPARSPNPSLRLMQFPSLGRQQDIPSGIPRSFSPGHLQDPFLAPPEAQLLRPTAAQDLHDALGSSVLSEWPALGITPPLSPLSFGSMRSSDLTRPGSPDPRGP